jgi:hypothetical protein
MSHCLTRDRQLVGTCKCKTDGKDMDRTDYMVGEIVELYCHPRNTAIRVENDVLGHIGKLPPKISRALNACMVHNNFTTLAAVRKVTNPPTLKLFLFADEDFKEDAVEVLEYFKTLDIVWDVKIV